MNPQSLRLQLAALAVLWLGLFAVRETQPLALIGVPLLLGLRIWNPPPLRRHRRSWSTAIGLALITAWLAGASLGDRGAWLVGFSNLLWLLCALTMLEVERPGAQRRAALLLLLATGTAGLFAQDLGPSLVQALAACLAVASLLALESGQISKTSLLRRLALLVGLSLPLMVVLFVLAPRLSPIWLLQGGGARTGLSDQLDPGSIASLARSDAPAMRLQFTGMAPPPPAERYWRVLTLNQFDGRRWSASPGEPALAAPTDGAAANLPPQINVLLEPTNLRWLPWGGTGLPWPNGIRRSADGGLWQEEPVRSRSLYRLAAAGRDAPQPWRAVPPTADDLRLPAASNPRLRALGQTWAQLPNPEARITAAQGWFLQQGFRYTLEPGLLPPNDALDAFLFEEQRGFCEHFAAAFSALMRAAAVPARVVIGYQGGAWVQPVGGGHGHLQVQQSDAHAWSEVWIQGRGWIRVDPTAWVVPSRTQSNLFDSLEAAGSAGDRRLLRQSPTWLQWLGGQWQALDLNWNLWVMQFDQSRQEALLRQWFGADAARWQGPLLLMALGFVLSIGLVLLQWLQTPAINRQRRQLDRCLEKLGLRPEPGEALEAAVQRFSQQRPELADALQQLAHNYSRLRFADRAQKPTPQQWTTSLRALAQHHRHR